MKTGEYIEELNRRYGEKKTGKLLSYIDMVLERTKYINLTSVRDRNEAVIKHLADSLSVTELLEYRDAKRIIDVGTGAGFPGALLAITSPEKEFVLLDSTLKKLKVIDEFAGALGIDNIRTVHARAEEISHKPGYAKTFDLCVSRAVASLDTLSCWCLPFVKKGGAFIAYKSENYAEELESAAKILSSFNARFDRTEKYTGGFDEISGHVLLVISL